LRDQVGNLAVFLPINTGLHNTHWGEQFYTFGRKHKKTLNLKFSPETKTSRDPHPWPLIFFLHTGHPLSLQKKTLNTPESFSSSSRSRRPRPSGSISQAAAPPLFWQRQTRAATTNTASPSSLISSLPNLKETHCQHRSLPLSGVFSSFDLHQRRAPPSHTTTADPLHHELGRHRPHLLSRSPLHNLLPPKNPAVADSSSQRPLHILQPTSSTGQLPPISTAAQAVTDDSNDQISHLQKKKTNQEEKTTKIFEQI